MGAEGGSLARPDLRRNPSYREAWEKARAAAAFETNDEAVPRVGARQELVVDHRGLPLLLGEQPGNRDQLAVGQVADARQAFVHRVVDLEILPLQLRVAKATYAAS